MSVPVPSQKKAEKSEDLNGRTRSPSVDVPSGKKQSSWSCAIRSRSIASWRLASLRRRSMKTVPVIRVMNPIPGQFATSAFETK